MSIPRRKVLLAAILAFAMVAVFLIGWTLARRATRQQSHDATGAVSLKPGPWGKLSYVPIEIGAPLELLPVKGTEATPVSWFFEGFRADDLVKFFESLGLSKEQWQQALDPQRLRVMTNGIALLPSREFALALSPKARSAIYKRLVLSSENDTSRTYFLASQLDEYGRHFKISADTLSLLKSLSAPHGKYLFCYSMPFVLSGIPSYQEKANLLKALSQKSTRLVRIRITPDSDVTALATYWGKACWSTDVKSILESLSRQPDGSWLDVIELLPPLPTSLLYTFPVPRSDLNGPPASRDCHWTSFNFFRDPPDDNYSLPAYTLEKLKTDFFPVQADPRFGDVVLLVKADGKGIHSAIYLADNIVYTKNGPGFLQPWMLSTLEDLLDIYSFNLPEGQELGVRYYRNKYY